MYQGVKDFKQFVDGGESGGSNKHYDAKAKQKPENVTHVLR